MTQVYGLPIGASLPPFTAIDDAGNTQTLISLMGENGLLLTFVYGTWCATCVQTLHALGRYAPQLGKEGINIAAVLIDEAADIRTFKQSSPIPISFPLLADKDESIHKAYHADSSKVYMVIDRDFTLHQQFIDFDGTQKPTLPTLITAFRGLYATENSET